MIPDTKTFCTAPWFQIRNQNDMTKRVCGSISEQKQDQDTEDVDPIDYLNSDHIIKLKQDLHNGTKNPLCSRCWKQEAVGKQSYRQKLNQFVTGNHEISQSWLKNYFSNKKNYHSDMLLMSDIKIGNTCNHACVMCIPDDSSLIYNKWQNNLQNEFVQEKLKQDPQYLERIKRNGYKSDKYRKYLEQVLQNTNLRLLKILGGEPLLDKTLLENLSQIKDTVKNRIELQIVTNGSLSLTRCADLLGDFKKINFVVSVEGVGKLQEYARKGSIWNTLSNNILEAKNYKNIDLHICHTFQTTTVLGFGDLEKWCEENGLPITIGFVNEPRHLSLASLKPQCRDKLKSNSKLSKNLFDTEYDTQQHELFCRYIDWYEQDSKIKLKDLYPELL